MTEQSLFEEFITERLNCQLVYHPEKQGFVYFKVKKDVCSVVELYVPIQFRGQGAAGWLMKQVEAAARANNCKHVSASVVFNTATAEEALAALIHYGFKVGELQPNSIYMIKEM